MPSESRLWKSRKAKPASQLSHSLDYYDFLTGYGIRILRARSIAASDSYLFGYNNRVGFLLLVGFATLGAFWWKRFPWDTPAAGESSNIPRRTLWICLAVALSACILIYYLTARLGHFGESTYLINRCEEADRGLRPYLDFEFAYGASFLYFPVLLGRMIHLTVPNGYYLFWTVSVLAGIWMLYCVINWIDYPSKYKRDIFLLIYLFMLPAILTTGLNYTGVRFLAVPLCALIVFDTIRDGTFGKLIAGSFLAAVFLPLLLLISPEMGVAFGIGISFAIILFSLRMRGKLRLVPWLGMVAIMAATIFAADRVGVFVTMKSVASTAFNFPIVPAPHILMLFATLFIAACYVAEKLVMGDFRSNAFFVVAVSLPSLAGAMGRCDPGHVLFNVLGLFLVVMLRVSNNPIAWNRYRFAFIVIFIVFGWASTLVLYSGEIARAANSLANGLTALNAVSNTVVLPPLLKGVARDTFSYSVGHNPSGLDGGYYFGLVNALEPNAVRLKIEELDQHPNEELLLPGDFEVRCHTDPELSRLLISVLFAYPLRRKAVHTDNVYAPLCDAIHRNYYLRVPPSPESFGYGIWARR